jgi:hypothetical protein
MNAIITEAEDASGTASIMASVAGIGSQAAERAGVMPDISRDYLAMLPSTGASAFGEAKTHSLQSASAAAQRVKAAEQRQQNMITRYNEKECGSEALYAVDRPE